jgi:chitin synthase
MCSISFGIELNSIRLIKTNRTLQEIAVALLATYGLYFISSFMHFEPWHMFTSFIQYMFLLPSYVNILMMYAMCNLHDVTWGTKGDNGAAKDLGGAKKVKGENGKEMLEVELPTTREDVDHLWAAARNALKTKAPEERQHRDAATKQADHDRNSRTNVVLAWVGSNMWVIFSDVLHLQVRLLMGRLTPGLWSLFSRQRLSMTGLQNMYRLPKALLLIPI